MSISLSVCLFFCLCHTISVSFCFCLLYLCLYPLSVSVICLPTLSLSLSLSLSFCLTLCFCVSVFLSLAFSLLFRPELMFWEAAWRASCIDNRGLSCRLQQAYSQCEWTLNRRIKSYYCFQVITSWDWTLTEGLFLILEWLEWRQDNTSCK